jgi:hypothetical protein
MKFLTTVTFILLALLLIVVNIAFSTAIVFVAYNYLLVPAFAFAKISWFQAFAVAVVVKLVTSTFNFSKDKE